MDSFDIIVSLLCLFIGWFISYACVTHTVYRLTGRKTPTYLLTLTLLFLLVWFILFICVIALLFCWFILCACVTRTAIPPNCLIHFVYLCHCYSSMLIGSFYLLVSLQFFFVDWVILCACVTHSSVPPDGFILCTCVTAIPPCWLIHFMYLCDCNSSWLINTFYILFTCYSSITHSSVPPNGFILCHC